jgi:thiol:disulfide interchange protein
MRMTKLLALLFLALVAAHPSGAAESAASVSKRATVALVSDTDAVAPNTAYRLGLRFQIAKGWHIYGQNSGDAGIPPELEWSLPPGTTVGPIAWPAPHRQPEGPLMTYGYTGTPMLTMPAKGPGTVKLHATWLICSNICVPEEADFSLDLPAGQPAPSAQAALFASADAALPRPSPFTAEIAPDATLSIHGAGLVPDAISDSWFIPNQSDRIVPTGAQSLRRSRDAISLSLVPGPSFHAGDPLRGTLFLVDRSGQETALAIEATPGAPAATGSLWRALGAALLGGLILNLMPCVFPVLAMKAMAIARLSSEARPVARAHAAGYTIGVLASFAAIGAAVIALRAFGHSIGWGFQFQSPVFVAITAWVLFAVGLNLSGVFEIPGRVAGMGQSLTLRRGFIGSFFSGALAVVVATPCTAPFMSVALAAALTAPPVETMALFLALGLGLAAPTVILTLLPGVAMLLPRPGRWMDILKQGLAFPMYAASVWLLWVISLQAGGDGVLATGAGFVLVGVAAWLSRFGRKATFALAACAVLAMAALLPGLGTPAAAQAETKPDSFTPARLAALRAEGRPVFLNFTAAWCVTCLVNERVALSPQSVQNAFAAANVAMLTGDWTRQNPDITAFLVAQGRDGVPLYLYYPPGGKPPIVLPQILTPQLVLTTIAGPA